MASLWYNTHRLQEKEKISIMLEDEKRQATEQAKMLEMDLEVCNDNISCDRKLIFTLIFQTVVKEKERTLQQVEVSILYTVNIYLPHSTFTPDTSP